ncbi:MAG: LptA/OstA family protein [Gammaproteobacteria bacterium]
MGFKMRFSLTFLFLLCLPLIAKAQEMLLDQSNKQPIDITSEELIFYRSQNIAVFSGHVVAIQGDTTVKANKMEVFFNGGNTKSDEKLSKVKSINLKENVEIITPQEKATATNGVYNVEQGIFTLNDDVVMNQGETILKGDKMVYNKNTAESLLTTNGKVVEKRVSARFVPNETGKNE